MKFLFVCLLVVAGASATRDKRSLLGAAVLPGVAVGLSSPGAVAVGPSHTGSVAVGPSNSGYVAVGPTLGAVVAAPILAPAAPLVAPALAVHSPLLGAGLVGVHG